MIDEPDCICWKCKHVDIDETYDENTDTECMFNSCPHYWVDDDDPDERGGCDFFENKGVKE